MTPMLPTLTNKIWNTDKNWNKYKEEEVCN